MNKYHSDDFPYLTFMQKIKPGVKLNFLLN